MIKAKIGKHKWAVIGGSVLLLIIIIVIIAVAASGGADEEFLKSAQLELTCNPKEQLKEFYNDYVLDPKE